MASGAAADGALSRCAQGGSLANQPLGFCWGSGPQTSAFRSLETGVEGGVLPPHPRGRTAPHGPGRGALREPVSASSRQSSPETPRFARDSSLSQSRRPRVEEPKGVWLPRSSDEPAAPRTERCSCPGCAPRAPGTLSWTLPAETGGWLHLGKVPALVCRLELWVLFCLQVEVSLRGGPVGVQELSGSPPALGHLSLEPHCRVRADRGPYPLRAPTRTIDSPEGHPALPGQVSLVGAEGGVRSSVSLERPLCFERSVCSFKRF